MLGYNYCVFEKVLVYFSLVYNCMDSTCCKKFNKGILKPSLGCQ